MVVRSSETSLCAVAALALAAGAWAYLYARGAQPWLPALASWTGALPTLAHTLAFVALSLAVIRPWPRLALWVCAGWLLLEGGLEVLQIDTVADWIGERMSSHSPILRAHLEGTFDALDLLAAAAGVLLAAAIAATPRPHGAAR